MHRFKVKTTQTPAGCCGARLAGLSFCGKMEEEQRRGERKKNEQVEEERRGQVIDKTTRREKPKTLFFRKGGYGILYFKFAHSTLGSPHSTPLYLFHFALVPLAYASPEEETRKLEGFPSFETF